MSMSFSEEDIVFELTESDNVISLFSGGCDDNSTEMPSVSANQALQSLENVKKFLIQQEGASIYLSAVNSLENFIHEKWVDSMKQSSITQFLVNN